VSRHAWCHSRTRRLLVASLLALVAGGCADTLREVFTARALDRASFELRCPREKLTLHELNARLDDRILVVEGGTQVGVSGCGHRAVYVWTSSGWMLNSESPGDGK
jgi:hypothetical protein